MSPPYLLTLSVLALLVVRINCQCTDQETSVASQEFKDCVDKKEYSLIHLDKAREDKKEFICAVFEQISDECSKALAKCRSREYVDDKVSLHINSISGNSLKIISRRIVSTKRDAEDNKFCESRPWKYFSH